MRYRKIAPVVEALRRVQGDLIRGRDLARLGVAPYWVRTCQFEKRERGVYQPRHTRAGEDPFTRHSPGRLEALSMRFGPSVVFGGWTALWLHDVIRDQPERVWIVIGPKAHYPMEVMVPLRVFRSRHGQEHVQQMHLWENTVPVHSAARAMVDCIAHDGWVDGKTALDWLRSCLAMGVSRDEMLAIATTLRVRRRVAAMLSRAT